MEDRKWSGRRDCTVRYRGLVAKAASEIWWKLPTHTRSWVTIDDLIQEGLEWIILHAARNYNSEKAKFETLIYIGVRNYLDTEYRQKYVVAEKRGEMNTVSLEALLYEVDRQGKGHKIDLSFVRAIASKNAEQTVLRNCWAVDLVMEVHRNSPIELRDEIVKWFVQKDTHRLRVDTVQFAKHARNFRRIAQRVGLEYEDCRHLFRSESCLDQLSRKLTWLPYDLDRPTPELYVI